MDKVFEKALQQTKSEKRVKQLSNFRAYPEELEEIKTAAKKIGVTYTMFIVAPALERARKILRSKK